MTMGAEPGGFNYLRAYNRKLGLIPDLMCVVVSLALSSPPLLTALHCRLLPLAGT